MEARATAKTIRITPRKARLVVDMIRSKDTKEAFAILKYTNKRACEAVYKVLKSACANAENNKGLSKDELYVVEAYANQGPSFKRVAFRGRGGVDTIIKRTCHITVVLDVLKK